jgi:antitoxin (DNA-binding transcriptional repressor) of toxin-antitoxin stability system
VKFGGTIWIMTRTVAAAEMKEHFDELLEELAETQEEVVVLRDGKPFMKVTPLVAASQRRITVEEFRRRYPVKILGDIMEPMDDEWDCMK